jgi:tripartite-type tricarboxylate transporter receptor subunit TctC
MTHRNADSGIPASRVLFHAFSISGSGVFCPKAARKTGRPEILIVATGSEHSVGWHRTSQPLHIHALRAPILEGTHVTNLKLPRRNFLHLAAGAATLSALPRIASALDYPTRPVHWIAGYPAGGGTDIFARLMAQSLSERLGQQFIVENRTGAASNIATELVVRAPADGYTLLETDAAAAINATLYEHLNFNFVRDITVIGVIRTPLLMLVHPSVPAKTVPEFIVYAKVNSGKIDYASGGIGNPLHVAAEMFKMMAEINMTHVPYRGVAPALADLLGGQVQVLFSGTAPAIEYIRAGKVRALAVTTTTRLEQLPDIPPMADFLPDYEASQWFAAGLGKNTPVEIIDKLNKEINASIAEPEMRARIAKLGATPMPGSPSDFGKFIAAETEKWSKVIRTANIKPE